MNDRELLELAAKAAGIEIDWDGDRALTVQMFRGHLKNWFDWNPLEDDGDALRLAVKLHMFDAGLFMAFRFEETRKDPSKDDYEITRRAIVRAAAEIGKGME